MNNTTKVKRVGRCTVKYTADLAVVSVHKGALCVARPYV